MTPLLGRYITRGVDKILRGMRAGDPAGAVLEVEVVEALLPARRSLHLLKLIMY